MPGKGSIGPKKPIKVPGACCLMPFNNTAETRIENMSGPGNQKNGMQRTFYCPMSFNGDA